MYSNEKSKRTESTDLRIIFRSGDRKGGAPLRCGCGCGFAAGTSGGFMAIEWLNERLRCKKMEEVCRSQDRDQW